MIELLSAVLGLVGGLGQRWFEARKAADDAKVALAELVERNAHELLMQQETRKTIELEAANALSLANIQAAKEADVAAYAAMRASYDADRATYSSGAPSPGQAWLLVAVDAIRGVTRPGITWAALGLLAYFYTTLPTGAPELQLLIDSVRAIAATAVAWWFASRPSGQSKT